MPRFTHLHVASAYSAHYGTARPETLVGLVAARGESHAALTDRDGLYGAVRHIRTCRENGITPIVGVDLAVCDAHNNETGRITILAHGRTQGRGWASLARTITAAHSKRRKTCAVPQSRLRGLLVGPDGVAVTVLLGPDSPIGRLVATGAREAARDMLITWKKELGAAICIEIVCHHTEPGHSRSVKHAAMMLELAEETDVPAVLTNAVRYLIPDDALTGDVLDAAHTLQPLGSFNTQPNGQAWLKPATHMHRIATRIARSSSLDGGAAHRLLAHTERVAALCGLDPETDIGWRQAKIPENDVIGLGSDPDRVLWQTAEAAIGERYPYASAQHLTRVRERMREELVTIYGFGFSSYFLTVADVSVLIRSMGIRNQARGSGAGSLVNYLLRISNVDPLEHDLLFERFLGNKRETLPDIDIDVESARRHDIYRAIFDRYGSTRVSLMAMQNTYRARGAVRDAGLALNLDDEQIDFVAKNIWRFNARSFRSALETKPELREFAEMIGHDVKLDQLVDITQRLDRLPRHVSMHPCGVILGNNDLYNISPMQPSGAGLPMSQFDKDDIDDVGLLKLDVLGVRMQSTLAYTLSEIKRIHGRDAAQAGGLNPDAPYIKPDGFIELDLIPHDDEATFENIRTAHTIGMFQIESPGQRELVGKMQPDEYNDLIADISLFRPGPMKGNMVAPFLDAKHGFTPPDYLHPRFRYFLQDSYGVVIYHEHVLRILHECMGVSLAEADELRRAMEKNTASIESSFRARTAANRDPNTGARRYSDRDIERIWTVLRGFGSFGFCKAHGAAFALPTYQSAWLKTHYPAEFLAGLLTHDPGMYPKRLLLAEARRLGVPILGVDVNLSDETYRVEPIQVESLPVESPPVESPPVESPAVEPEAPPPSPGDALVVPAPSSRTTRLGIRMSVRDIHGISNAETSRILAERPYRDLLDFYERARPSRPLFQRLALIGGLDQLARDEALRTAPQSAPPARGDIIARVRQLTAHARPRHSGDTQLDFTVDYGHLIPRTHDEFTTAQQIDAEMSVLGIDATAHVIETYRPLLDELGVVSANELLSQRNRTEVLVAGVRVATQTPPMRSGKRVVFISLDDGTGCADATFFEEAQNATGPLLFGTKYLVIRGRTRRTGERGISIEADRAWDLRELWAQYRQFRTSVEA